jgi:hypothetical protein
MAQGESFYVDEEEAQVAEEEALLTSAEAGVRVCARVKAIFFVAIAPPVSRSLETSDSSFKLNTLSGNLPEKPNLNSFSSIIRSLRRYYPDQVQRVDAYRPLSQSFIQLPFP